MHALWPAATTWGSFASSRGIFRATRAVSTSPSVGDVTPSRRGALPASHKIEKSGGLATRGKAEFAGDSATPSYYLLAKLSDGQKQFERSDLPTASR